MLGLKLCCLPTKFGESDSLKLRVEQTGLHQFIAHARASSILLSVQRAVGDYGPICTKQSGHHHTKLEHDCERVVKVRGENSSEKLDALIRIAQETPPHATTDITTRLSRLDHNLQISSFIHDALKRQHCGERA